MPHELYHERRPDYTGELTLGLAPDGGLQFYDGVATVDDQARADAIVDRYPAISDVGPTDTDEGSESFDAAAFVDRTPMEGVVTDIESGEYDAHLDTIEAAEAEARDRQGVADAVAARRE